MFRNAVLGAAFTALLVAAPAAAQEVTETGGVPVGTVYGGFSGGYHDLGVDAPGDDGGAIYGGVLGFDVPVSGPVTIGLEGNYHLGTDAIDNEFGVAARLGYRFASGGIAYVRGGYQKVNIDVNQFAGVDLDGFDIEDSADDYIVGVGGDFALGASNLRVRAAIDTVSFDSIRPTAGLILAF